MSIRDPCAALVIVVWAVCGSFFDYSDTWQLVVNTSTTIVTFLMVFLIQNTQNRDGEAIQGKLDELIRSIDGAHLALLEDEYRRRGMSGEAATLAARRAIGSVAHATDLHRDTRSFAWLEDAQRDVRHAWRLLLREPGFTALALLTLALGIGATTSVFSVVSGVLLTPLPYPEPERLVRVFGPPPSVTG